jgi:hypothetical protein
MATGDLAESFYNITEMASIRAPEKIAMTAPPHWQPGPSDKIPYDSYKLIGFVALALA